MKYFNIIFAFYFLTLAVMPCGDKDCSDESNNCTTSTIAAQCTSHQDTQHEDGICSPLCMCHCCGGVTLLSNVTYNTLVIDTFELNTLYNSNNPSEISIAIWQPPKV